MLFSDYFDFPSKTFAQQNKLYSVSNNNVIPYTGGVLDLSPYKLAFIGITDDRGIEIKGSSKSPDLIREKFYGLSKFNSKIKIIDLGNLKTGKTLTDAYFCLREVIIELLAYHVCPIIIGGNSDFAYPVFLAFEKIQRNYNLVFIDSKIGSFKKGENTTSDYDSLSIIVNTKPSYLFNITHFGHQTYLSDPESLELLNKLNYKLIRLGSLRSDLKESEPDLRDADFVSFSMNSIRQSDAPSASHPSPNGLFGEEACQLAQYAGASDKVSIFGLLDVNTLLDSTGQTTHLAAQLVWYFVNGFLQRKIEDPVSDTKEYRKFIVKMNEKDFDLIFYKSLITDRWWIELQNPNKKNMILPCSYNDYLGACNQEIPERYWKASQKINR